ncbi:hypothetical protein QJQ45_006520 [Haematococcus lacustris]|nr:hypothetical protein QJQ45_006520 [Haematococcus lacustris]
MCQVVFTVDRACQLLGVGLCGTQGAYTVELDVYEVEPEEYSNEVCTLQSVAQSFTKTDGQLIRLYLNSPALLQPNKFYMLSALIKGTESFCCEECMDTVIAGGVKVSFQSWESPNGTNEARGQFPELYISPLATTAVVLGTMSGLKVNSSMPRAVAAHSSGLSNSSSSSPGQ